MFCVEAVASEYSNVSLSEVWNPLDAALRYAARGWRVFPCHSAIGGKCSCNDPTCSSPGKHPRIRGWPRAATTNPARINDWWLEWPDANVAIVTGASSGIIVLDIDRRHGGYESLSLWENTHGALPDTVKVLTGGGGLHLFFQHPGYTISNSVSTLGATGIDIRGDGGYVVAPPSLHASGQLYEWDATHLEDEAPAPLPPWLLTRLMAGNTAAPQQQSTRFQLPDYIPCGQRWDTWQKYAASLRAYGYDQAAILKHLNEANATRTQELSPPKELEALAAWAASLPAGTAHNHDPDEVAAIRARIAQAAAVAETLSWRGPFGRTCRTVYSAILSEMDRDAKLALEASGRFLVPLTGGKPHTSVARALRVLSGVEKSLSVPALLHREPSKRYTIQRQRDGTEFVRAYQYRLRRAEGGEKDTNPLGGAREVCARIATLISHDAFRTRRGLPESCAIVLVEIEDKPGRTIAELARRTTLARSTVRTALDRLRDERLVELHNGIWQRGPATLDEVAQRLGTTGAAAQQAAKQRTEHSMQREAYHKWLRNRPHSQPREGKLYMVPKDEAEIDKQAA